jgi:hypothetical protein
MAAPGWIWHAPRNNQFVRLWSQEDDQNLKKVGHASHFVQIEARRLADDQAREANARLAESVGAAPQPLSEVFELQLKTDTGKTKVAFFVISEANARIGNLWAYTCGQTCAERIIFMIWKPQ